MTVQPGPENGDAAQVGPAWWQRDSGWSVPGAVAAVGIALGALALSVVPGLGGVLGAEAGFGVAAGFAVATGVRLRRAYRRRADDDADTSTAGIGHELTATGTVSSGPIATITRESSTDRIAALHREALHPEDGPAVHTITMQAGQRRLRLQHRLGTDDDTDLEDPAPDLVVRWIDGRGAAVAGAHRCGGRWTIPAARLTLHIEVPDDRRRRPSRRTFVDASGRAFLLTYETRRRLPLLRFAAPAELGLPEVVLCMWLAQLLDAHAAAGERWRAPGSGWTLVADDFPSYVGPGGFGRDFTLPVPSIGGGGGS